ncbi:MAG: hormogonium polysaccharide biosynthesis glycosyltransferase HpsE [Microcoleaceae cyanobacterium]
MVDFTVAIPTYNGAQRLSGLLEKLRLQTQLEDVSWEVIVIDNNSSDNTAKLVQQYQQNWIAGVELKYYFEPEQGLAFARQRAINEAKGEFVGFLDDDNRPAPEWLVAAYQFGQTHPQAGAYGSRILGEFEVSPPENFERIAPLLALTDRGSEPRYYEPQKKLLPPGAGLVVRRQAWLTHVPARLVLIGRVGGQMLASEEFEALLHIQNAGWQIWYNPAMVVYHCIPRQRLERGYLMGLCRGIGLSRYRTRMLSVSTWQKPLALVAYLLNDLRKIIRHLIKYRTSLKTDLVAACELELYWSCLKSPFFFWTAEGSHRRHRM